MYMHVCVYVYSYFFKKYLKGKNKRETMMNMWELIRRYNRNETYLVYIYI